MIRVAMSSHGHDYGSDLPGTMLQYLICLTASMNVKVVLPTKNNSGVLPANADQQDVMTSHATCLFAKAVMSH